MTPAWSWYVIALVVLNILGCVWLIWWTGKRRPGDPAPTETSHVWDGDLTEYNQPMPRWWINLFYITIVFAIGYLIYYPGMGSFKGTSGWTSQAEHDADKAVQDAKIEQAMAPYAGQPLPALAANPAALKLGQATAPTRCAIDRGGWSMRGSVKSVTAPPRRPRELRSQARPRPCGQAARATTRRPQPAAIASRPAARGVQASCRCDRWRWWR